jgi:hypothetical protein
MPMTLGAIGVDLQGAVEIRSLFVVVGVGVVSTVTIRTEPELDAISIEGRGE